LAKWWRRKKLLPVMADLQILIDEEPGEVRRVNRVAREDNRHRADRQAAADEARLAWRAGR